MYFDFEDNRPDTPTIPRPMSPREVVLITVNLHLVFLVDHPARSADSVREEDHRSAASRRSSSARRWKQLEQQQERPRFVFMQPRLERPVPPPKRAEMSDIDRRARSVERAPDPRNPLPVLARQHH